MVNIVHPGELIEPLILSPAGLSQSAFARHLGFNQPQPINELVKGKRGVTPKMALLLEKATGGVYPAEFWLLAQLRFDLAGTRSGLPDHRAALVENVAVSGKPSVVKDAGQLATLKLSKQIQTLS
ncbi:MAG: HigA family addiction module antitoxin [Gammaproteobacteria bacterium]|nr:HigA family addiction module antitoxin [Gammaproteobacteria bacterium]